MLEIELNICQVSLNRDIPLILENYKNFKKLYKKNIHFFVICPNKQVNEFKEKLYFDEFKIINEDEIIEFKEFENIYNKLSKKIDYSEVLAKRLKWYYQQVLKISFSINFVKKNNKNVVIWDADTILLKKIIFFQNNISVKYGNFFEFHKAYYLTNEYILKKLPNYFISSLNQFIAISKDECNFFVNNFLSKEFDEKYFGAEISKIIFQSIFAKHKFYNGSMFSEYELLGQSNYLYNPIKQKPLLFLRFGLDGKLNDSQKNISSFLGFKHITYEHSHKNIKGPGMLNRTQSWTGFVKIIFKNFLKYYLRSIKHTIMYNFKR